MKFINKYHIVLCLLVSISSVCFGMDEEGLWRIDSISNDVWNPYLSITQHLSGKLEIFYVPKDNTYEFAAQFKPNDISRKIIRFENFGNDQYQEVKKLESSLGSVSGEIKVVGKYPFTIANKDKYEALTVTTIEQKYELEELLGMKRCYVVLKSDSILLKYAEDSQEIIELCHQDNIKAIRDAVYSGSPFTVNICTSSIYDQFKVTDYTNGSYLQWNGWVPFFHFLCVGMPMLLTIVEKPKQINIDLTKDKKESLHHYKRNKLIGRGLMLLTGALIGYLLRNKIYNIGSLLLQ
jgi:hypothetical protein